MGVPASTPVAEVKVTPTGRDPAVCVIVGAGRPLAVTVNVPAVPTVKVVEVALVKAGDSRRLRVMDAGVAVSNPFAQSPVGVPIGPSTVNTAGLGVVSRLTE